MPVIKRTGKDDITLYSDLPAPNTKAPEFKLLNDNVYVTLDSFAGDGKTIILHTFPTLETENCRRSVETFNKRASELQNTKILCVSTDSVYVLNKNKESLPNVTLLCGMPSFDLNYPNFGRDYGVGMMSPDRLGVLFARAVFVIRNGVVLYSDYSKDLSPEGINYDACIKVAQSQSDIKAAKDCISASAAGITPPSLGAATTAVIGDPSTTSSKVVGFSLACSTVATAAAAPNTPGTGAANVTPFMGEAQTMVAPIKPKS